ncbi:hypothetical protein P8452_76217 [Trifolium repens]|nr:hypothetical protein P8452_76217 [Trifolium repens]
MQDSLFVFNFGYNYFEIEFQNIHCGTPKKIAITKWDYRDNTNPTLGLRVSSKPFHFQVRRCSRPNRFYFPQPQIDFTLNPLISPFNNRKSNKNLACVLPWSSILPFIPKSLCEAFLTLLLLELPGLLFFRSCPSSVVVFSYFFYNTFSVSHSTRFETHLMDEEVSHWLGLLSSEVNHVAGRKLGLSRVDANNALYEIKPQMSWKAKYQ